MHKKYIYIYINQFKWINFILNIFQCLNYDITCPSTTASRPPYTAPRLQIKVWSLHREWVMLPPITKPNPPNATPLTRSYYYRGNLFNYRRGLQHIVVHSNPLCTNFAVERWLPAFSYCTRASPSPVLWLYPNKSWRPKTKTLCVGHLSCIINGAAARWTIILTCIITSYRATPLLFSPKQLPYFPGAHEQIEIKTCINQ